MKGLFKKLFKKLFKGAKDGTPTTQLIGQQTESLQQDEGRVSSP